MNRKVKNYFEYNPITFFLIAVMFLVFGYELYLNFKIINNGIFSPINSLVLLELGAQVTGTKSLDIGTFIKTSLMHGSLIHIFLNMMFFLRFGPIFEGSLGKKRYITAIISISILSGLVLSYAPIGKMIVVGFSAVIFGLFGVLIGLGINVNVYKQLQKQSTSYVIILFLIGALMPATSNFGHLSGLVCGIVFGFFDGLITKGKR